MKNEHYIVGEVVCCTGNKSMMNAWIQFGPCNIQQYMNYIALWLGKVATWKLTTRKGQKLKVE